MNSALVTIQEPNKPSSIPRTSRLSAPTILLSGHKGGILTCRFSPSGSLLASAGIDRQIFIWDAFGENKNISVMQGHKNQIIELQWSHDDQMIFTASADKTAGVWDTESATLLKRIKLPGYVHSVSAETTASPLVLVGCDDSIVRLYDIRVHKPQAQFKSSSPVTALCFTDMDNFFAGGLDNYITKWNITSGQTEYSLMDNGGTITGLGYPYLRKYLILIALSRDKNYILSNSMDNRLQFQEIGYFILKVANNNRCIRVLLGAIHDQEQLLLRCCWSSNDAYVSAGSSDRLVNIWQVKTGNLVYRLPGHNATVTQTDFHPNEPIILSGSIDRQLYLGELAPE